MLTLHPQVLYAHVKFTESLKLVNLPVPVQTQPNQENLQLKKHLDIIPHHLSHNPIIAVQLDDLPHETS